MPDYPVLQGPLANTKTPVSVDPTGGQLPTGPKEDKLNRLQVILQGLIGARG